MTRFIGCVSPFGYSDKSGTDTALEARLKLGRDHRRLSRQWLGSVGPRFEGRTGCRRIAASQEPLGHSVDCIAEWAGHLLVVNLADHPEERAVWRWHNLPALAGDLDTDYGYFRRHCLLLTQPCGGPLPCRCRRRLQPWHQLCRP